MAPKRTARDTTVVPVRVPNALLAEMKTLLDTQPLSPWVVDVLHEAVRSQTAGGLGGPPPTLTGVMREAWEKGRRAGWAAANQVVREGLKAASDKLKTMRP